MNQPIRIPETMNAVGIEGGEGPAEALKLVTLPTPKPGVCQILVRVAAAGVSQPDLVQCEGRCPLPPGTPETMGLEIAGEVVALVNACHAGKLAILCVPCSSVEAMRNMLPSMPVMSCRYLKG